MHTNTLCHRTSDLSVHSNHSITNNYHNARTNYNSTISCCYLNIRSLVNKLSLFQAYVYLFNFDVICLSETWLSESVFDQEILPTNYSIYRKDRPSRGGGVLIAVKDTIPVSVHPSDLSNNAPEILTVTLNLCKPTILSCVYLPPSPNDYYMNDAISNLTQVIQSNQSADTIIVGDFNLPDIQWDTLFSTSPSSSAFCDFVFDNSLIQMIDEPTHVKGNILDLSALRFQRMCYQPHCSLCQ